MTTDKNDDLERLTAPRTIASEGAGIERQPASARELQLQDQIRANELPVTLESKLALIEKELKEAEMRVNENISHVINVTVGKEPDMTAHLEASAIFHQKKCETLTRTAELIRRQIEIREAQAVDKARHAESMKAIRESSGTEA